MRARRGLTGAHRIELVGEVPVQVLAVFVLATHVAGLGLAQSFLHSGNVHNNHNS